ncbi:CHASE domain-containing protein [Litoribrevibacter euphylliae]|uniref:histidine kinase n=1 Tax=Litoribrevibacter euphylliae TaxID=1834034 RepID=A0ABV7HBM8_9GAMM
MTSNLKYLHWYHWAVLVGSIILTATAWYVSKTQSELKVKLQFEFQANQLVDLVKERMSHYEDALHAGVAAIHSQSHGIDSLEWKRFATTFNIEQKYKGINGIGVIYYVEPSRLKPFLEEERQIRPDFTIHPKHNKNEYWPITYIEPVADNLKAVGLDMAFESNRYTAAKKARDTGMTQITAPITLVQDAKKTPGFLQYVPIYKDNQRDTLKDRQDNFIGHVYAPFIMHKLIEGTLKQTNRQLMFSLYDQEFELFNELLPSNTDYDPNPLYVKELEIDMYGRPWRFTIQSSQSFRKASTDYQSTMILAGGIIIDTTLLLLFLALAKSNSRAISLAEDMTQQLRDSEEYFRHIIQYSPCALLLMDANGIIELTNPEAERLFGYSKSELVGKNINELIPNCYSGDTTSSDTSQYEEDIKLSCSYREITGITQSNVELPLQVSLSSFTSNDGEKVLTTIVDISETQNIMEELKRSNKELDDFAYVASHDLKAPLRGIIQLSSWIEEDAWNEIGDESKQHITLLKGRTKRLERLLDDLLAYSRIGRSEGNTVEVHVSDMVKEIFSLLSPPDGFQLFCEEPLPVFQTLQPPFEQIFRNLISNAIKHHDQDTGCIRISCSETATDYVFTVSDDGPGIDQQHHEKVFEIFQTLKPRDEVEGSGMGLAIIKKILDFYKANITIIPLEGRGTAFVFTWPKQIEKSGS